MKAHWAFYTQVVICMGYKRQEYNGLHITQPLINQKLVEYHILSSSILDLLFMVLTTPPSRHPESESCGKMFSLW